MSEDHDWRELKTNLMYWRIPAPPSSPSNTLAAKCEEQYVIDGGTVTKMGKCVTHGDRRLITKKARKA
jgi:hypothetical protein